MSYLGDSRECFEVRIARFARSPACQNQSFKQDFTSVQNSAVHAVAKVSVQASAYKNTIIAPPWYNYSMFMPFIMYSEHFEHASEIVYTSLGWDPGQARPRLG